MKGVGTYAMCNIKSTWDVVKTLWDMTRTVAPGLRRLYRLRRSPWIILVRKGAGKLGTPAAEVQRLLEAFDQPAFYVAEAHHPLLNEIRRSLWAVHQRLDEMALLAEADGDGDVARRCWALGQVGQRCGLYALPVVRSIADSLRSPEDVKAAAERAIEEIRGRFSEG